MDPYKKQTRYGSEWYTALMQTGNRDTVAAANIIAGIFGKHFSDTGHDTIADLAALSDELDAVFEQFGIPLRDSNNQPNRKDAEELFSEVADNYAQFSRIKAPDTAAGALFEAVRDYVVQPLSRAISAEYEWESNDEHLTEEYTDMLNPEEFVEGYLVSSYMDSNGIEDTEQNRAAVESAFKKVCSGGNLETDSAHGGGLGSIRSESKEGCVDVAVVSLGDECEGEFDMNCDGAGKTALALIADAADDAGVYVNTDWAGADSFSYRFTTDLLIYWCADKDDVDAAVADELKSAEF